MLKKLGVILIVWDDDGSIVGFVRVFYLFFFEEKYVVF